MSHRYFLLFTLLALFAVFNVSTGQTSVTVDVLTNTSWNLAGSPFTISSSISVKKGAILTIDSNVVVNIESGGTLTIADSAKLMAKKVTFSRAAAGEAQIVFASKSSGIVDSCFLTNVYIYCNGPSTPSISNSRFTTVTYPVWLNDGAIPGFSGNSISGASNQGIKLSGNVNRSWTIPNYGLPYFVDGDVRLYASNCSLTLADGNTFNFLGSSVLYSYSSNTFDTLRANNVTFNRSGTGSPAIEFDGTGTGSITNCTLTGMAIGVQSGSPTITNNTLTGQSRAVAIYVNGSGSPVVGNNTITGYTYPYSLNDGATINLSGNTISGNTYTGIALGGNVNRNWIVPNYGLPYYVDGNVRLYVSNCKLTLADGNTLNFLGSNVIYTYSSNTCDTLKANNVTFNRIGTGTPAVEFDGTGTGSITNCTFTGVALGVGSGSPTITSNAFTGQARTVAIYVNGPGSPVVTSNTISGYTYPYSLNDGATINLGANTISGNTYTGIALGGNVSRSWTIPNYGLPYYVDASVRLYESNCRLTVADGDTLNFIWKIDGTKFQSNSIAFSPGKHTITLIANDGRGVKNSIDSVQRDVFVIPQPDLHSIVFPKDWVEGSSIDISDITSLTNIGFVSDQAIATSFMVHTTGDQSVVLGWAPHNNILAQERFMIHVWPSLAYVNTPEPSSMTWNPSNPSIILTAPALNRPEERKVNYEWRKGTLVIGHGKVIEAPLNAGKNIFTVRATEQDMMGTKPVETQIVIDCK